jgi:hypothetical protein
MAPVKQIVVTLSNPQEKKSVTRFDATDDDAALRTVYVDKAALAKLGNPDAIKVTITKAA